MTQSEENGLIQTELRSPYLPDCPRVGADSLELGEIREQMNKLSPHEETDRSLKKLFDDWNSDSRHTKPLQTIREIMNSMRQIPRGDERVAAMNTFVRTLGTATNLAILLDMLRQSAKLVNSTERELTNYSRLDPMHSSYGWCGQTKLACSSEDPTSETVKPEAGVQEILGSAPAARWSLSMHIWQPNPNAKGFPIGKQVDSDLIFEPPHSHPFDFASMVSIGSMTQTIYAETSLDGVASFSRIRSDNRYDGIDLNHVHGVWPPHKDRILARLNSRERIDLLAGDSYFLPCNMIHDVEIDVGTSLVRPAITLFLRSEAVVKSHVYMVKSMLDFHQANPSIKHLVLQPLQEEDWDTKLKLVSNYLRQEIPILNLAEIVKQKSEYAFFNR